MLVAKAYAFRVLFYVLMFGPLLVIWWWNSTPNVD